jgi:regulatory protein
MSDQGRDAMQDRTHDEQAGRLAPVSYLPWAVPGVDRADPGPGDVRPNRADPNGADPDHADADHAGAQRRHPSGRGRSGERASRQTPGRGGRVTALGSARGVSGDADARDAGEAGVDPVETGAERDLRVDRLVIGRLRRSSLSVAEVRGVLVEHGLDEAEVEEWIERYTRLGYLDDARLAEQVVHTSAERRGRGSGAILAELGRRGVDPAAARAAIDELDPETERQNAFAVAERRARQLGGLDRATAERRLTAFLQRRGYASGVVREAVASALSAERS